MVEYICRKCQSEVKLKITGTIDDVKCELNSDGEAIIEEDDVEMNVWQYECSKCNNRSKDLNEIAIKIEIDKDPVKTLINDLEVFYTEIKTRNYSKTETLTSLREILDEYKKSSK